ncbi:MAG: peroxide stress protein YaaA [Oscillospiraceae bacterium]|nr:peroxide stress protein YaaA [Oscillospiraceae bacterium]
MRIIISPAKKMRTDNDYILPRQLPVFIKEAELLRKYLRGLSYDELKKLWACNDDIARLNYDRLQHMDLYRNLSPAILSYDGIQYQYMAPQVFENSYFEYVETHLRIISGLYGILKPFDGIVPYRLEMQAKLKTDFCSNLYDYWKDKIYSELAKDNDVILNLASNEYSKTVIKYLSPDIRLINCIFGEMIGGKVKEKGVYVKMARGEMVRYMAENNIEDIEQIKGFDRLGFSFSDELSEPDQYVFLK